LESNGNLDFWQYMLVCVSECVLKWHDCWTFTFTAKAKLVCMMMAEPSVVFILSSDCYYIFVCTVILSECICHGIAATQGLILSGSVILPTRVHRVHVNTTEY